MENNMNMPEKIKYKTTMGSNNSNPHIYLKELTSGSQKDAYTPLGSAALITITKVWKQSKCPWMDE